MGSKFNMIHLKTKGHTDQNNVNITNSPNTVSDKNYLIPQEFRQS